jgi:hypothetical protein
VIHPVSPAVAWRASAEDLADQPAALVLLPLRLRSREWWKQQQEHEAIEQQHSRLRVDRTRAV